jgi:hypothetical protein
MKIYILIIFLFVSLTGCCPSDDTVKLSKGIAAFEAQQYSDVMKLIEDEDIKAKYPALVKKIKVNGAGLVRATKVLWLLLEGVKEDKVIE